MDAAGPIDALGHPKLPPHIGGIQIRRHHVVARGPVNPGHRVDGNIWQSAGVPEPSQQFPPMLSAMKLAGNAPMSAQMDPGVEFTVRQMPSAAVLARQ